MRAEQGWGGTATPASIQEELIELQNPEKDDRESVGSTESTVFLAQVIPRKELLQFMETTLHSEKKVQLTLHCLGGFPLSSQLSRALVGESKGHKESNTKKLPPGPQHPQHPLHL